MGIKTKFLTSHRDSYCSQIDDLINNFLGENQDIEIIDIKFQSNVSAVADGGVSGTYYNDSALNSCSVRGFDSLVRC